MRFAVYQLAFLLFEAAVTLRALLGDYRMSSGFSHYLHSFRWHRNTPGQSWWAVATNMTRGVSQHLPFLVLTPACLAVDALPVCFSAAVSSQVVTRAIGRLREVLPVVGEAAAKSGACLCEVLARVVAFPKRTGDSTRSGAQFGMFAGCVCGQVLSWVFGVAEKL